MEVGGAEGCRGEVGGGRKVAMVVEGGEITVKVACMCCCVADGGFDDGRGRLSLGLSH